MSNQKPDAVSHRVSLGPPFLTDGPLREQLLDPRVRTHLKRFMRQLGIRALGPSNQCMVAEAIRNNVEVGATKQGFVQLAYDRRRFWWNNGGTNLNAPLARRLVRQKEIASRALRYRGVKAPENVVFDARDRERAWAWVQGMESFVIKPPAGSKGAGVYVGLASRRDFDQAFIKLAKDYREVLLEEYIPGSEHRVFVVDGKVQAAGRRIPSNVMGDGQSTIRELIAAKNRTAIPPHKPIALGEIEKKELYALGLREQSIPALGERVLLRRNSNLSTGGDSIDVTDDLHSQEVNFVESAAACFPGLRVAGWDVLLPRSEGDSDPTVLEVNAWAGTAAHQFPREGDPRDLSATILRTMFPKLR